MTRSCTTKTELRTGITTGTCAAAAAQAAALCLTSGSHVQEVLVRLPSGRLIAVEIKSVCRLSAHSASATVQKYAGDDPDVTDGALISTTLKRADQDQFKAGSGVGVITKDGLQFPPGEPAVNPVPRQMILDAVHSVLHSPVEITISVKNGEQLAEQTYNPRLGIIGGISILGTTGIVRPYCHKAMCEAIALTMRVANLTYSTLFLTPGNIGTKGLNRHFNLHEEQLIEVGNEWGFPVDQLKKHQFKRVVAAGHPGKLAKLINNDWQTHSKNSGPANESVVRIGKQVLNRPLPPANTVEGFFMSLDLKARSAVGYELAAQIAAKLQTRAETDTEINVVLFNMAGEIIGRYGAYVT